jgi:predicted small metal-binding protein
MISGKRSDQEVAIRRRFLLRLLRSDCMISLEDCIALSGLTEEQILAIAEHEQLPEIAATAFAQYLSKEEHGMEKIRDMIVDDIRQAQQRQDKPHILTLLHVLHHFLKSHPEVCPPQHPWRKLY